MSETNISKIIHYCWFGGNPKTELMLMCIDSWKKHMPDFEIKEWNEKNYDITKSNYTKEAYQQKKWAFVSDYARFDIIYQYGGIYFDTDVELLKPIPDEVLAHNNAFTGFESAGNVSPGLVYADIPKGKITSEILGKYNKLHFLINGTPTYVTVNEVVTDILKPYGLVLNDTFQIVNGLAIYPSSVFCGFDQNIKEIDIHEDTISVHHYAGTWTKITPKGIVRKYFKKIFGVKGYRSLLNLYRKIKRVIIKNDV